MKKERIINTYIGVNSIKYSTTIKMGLLFVWVHRTTALHDFQWKLKKNCIETWRRLLNHHYFCSCWVLLYWSNWGKVFRIFCHWFENWFCRKTQFQMNLLKLFQLNHVLWIGAYVMYLITQLNKLTCHIWDWIHFTISWTELYWNG